MDCITASVNKALCPSLTASVNSTWSLNRNGASKLDRIKYVYCMLGMYIVFS